MNIGNFDTNERVFIIAEIGNNHEGNFEIAKKMISEAAASGVDAVKFQTFIPEHISSGDKTRLDRLRGFQFSYDQFSELSLYAKRKGLIFFSTPFDIESAKFLNTIQPIFKIASGDNNFFPLIETVANFYKPMIISTGIISPEEIKKIETFIKKIWHKNNVNPGLSFLHCVASYPVPDDQANLASIIYLNKIFPEVVIGYSDHTLGIKAAVMSVIAGSRIIEKHFTLDKNYSNFRDHQLSADPKELAILVKEVRKAEEMLGIEEKKTQICEKEMNLAGRRSIAAGQDLKNGSKLKFSNLTWVRPGNGLSPGNESKIIGKILKRDLKFGEIIKQSDLS